MKRFITQNSCHHHITILILQTQKCKFYNRMRANAGKSISKECGIPSTHSVIHSYFKVNHLSLSMNLFVSQVVNDAMFHLSSQ